MNNEKVYKPANIEGNIQVPGMIRKGNAGLSISKVYKSQIFYKFSNLRVVSMSPSDSQELLDVYFSIFLGGVF